MRRPSILLTYERKRIALAYRLLKILTRRFRPSTPSAYFFLSAVAFLPFSIVDRITFTKTRYPQSQSLAGYQKQGSLTELELFEKGGKIATAISAIIDRSLASNVDYELLRRAHIQQILPALEAVRFKSMLEVGSGASINLYYLSRWFPEKEYIGVDFAGERTRQAKTYWDKRNVRLSYVRGDATRLPFKDNSVDVVFSSHCLEQLSKDSECEAAIREMHRISAKKVVMMEPGYELGNPTQKSYIELRGYSKHILSIVKRNGFDLAGYFLLETTGNALNPTMMIVVNKS
jgi:SAM-dependent methyltransferase